MFRIRLVLEKGPDRWVFRIGKTFRLVNLVAAAGLIAAGILLGTVLLPAVLASVAVLGALYQESASFDRAQNRVEFQLGLLVLHRTRAFSLDSIAEVRSVGFGAARFTALEIGLKDGRVMTIENDRGKASAERLAAWGAELAEWLAVPLVTS